MNEGMVEGYVVVEPEMKSAYEKMNMNYVRFRILHYDGKKKYYYDCVSFNDHMKEYILQHISRQERVLVKGKIIPYQYKDPTGKKKFIMSILINSPNDLRKILIDHQESIDQKQEIGIPEGPNKVLVER